MIAAHSTIVRSEDLVSAPLGEEIAMLNIDSGSYFVLDDIAAVIWEGLQAPTTPATLCTTLQERYDVPPEQCEADVLRFLETLLSRGLVRIVQ